MHDTLKAITQAAGKYRFSRVVLFGSRARGDHRPTSDYDIAVFGVTDTEAAARFVGDLDALDTLHKFDVVFVDERTDPALCAAIKEEGVTLVDKLGLKIEQLSRALERLSEAASRLQSEPGDEIVRDALIQRFEFCFELAWKGARAYLNAAGVVDIDSPRSVMREAFAQRLVADDALWLAMIRDRNLTVHLYDEETAARIAEHIAQQYIPAYQALLYQLQA